MARTTLTPIEVPEEFDMAGADLAFTAADPVNGNDFVATGREVLVAQNSGAGPLALTVRSAAYNERTGDAVKTIAAGAFAVFQMFPTDGWMQSDGRVWVDAVDAALKLAVLKLP